VSNILPFVTLTGCVSTFNRIFAVDKCGTSCVGLLLECNMEGIEFVFVVIELL